MRSVSLKLLVSALFVTVTALLVVVLFPTSFLAGPSISALSILLGLAIAYPIKRRQFRRKKSLEVVAEEKDVAYPQQNIVSNVAEVAEKLASGAATRSLEIDSTSTVSKSSNTRDMLSASVRIVSVASTAHVLKAYVYKTPAQPKVYVTQELTALIAGATTNAYQWADIEDSVKQISVAESRSLNANRQGAGTHEPGISSVSEMLRGYMVQKQKETRFLN